MRIQTLSILFLSVISSEFSIAQSTVHKVFVSASEEDAEQEGSFIDVNDNELDLGWDQGEMSSIGLFFRDVFIEASSEVEAANLTLTAASELTDTLKVTIRLENNPYPDVYAEDTPLTSGRTFFASTIDWTIPPIQQSAKAYSPELKSLLQPLINASNWKATSNFNFIIEPKTIGNDTVRREFEAYAFDQIERLNRPALRMVVDSANINGIIQSGKDEVAFSMYPNPATHTIQISFSDQTADEVCKIFASNGQLVKTITMEQSANTIDVSSLKSGVYYVSVSPNMPFKKLIIGH